VKKSMGAKTLVYPTPVLVVGTFDAQEKPNAMTVAWGGICCSKPPCVAISVRAATYTYDNLMRTRSFCISIPSEKHVVEADYFGLFSGRDVDKWEATGLTPIKSELVTAPYIEEFPVTLECKVVNVTELGEHTQFVGEVLDVKIEDGCLDDSGHPLLSLIKPIMASPGEWQYYGAGVVLAKAFSAGKSLVSGE